MRIYLVRHGESEANVAGIINDDPARWVALTKTGRTQAENAAKALRGIPFTHTYASEFQRPARRPKSSSRAVTCFW